MHHALVKILEDCILSQFVSEALFCETYLALSEEEWQQWKATGTGLKPETMTKIKLLFTDYEWMVVNKLIRQTEIFPEKRQIIVEEYRRVKALIAKTWLNHGAEVEAVQQTRAYDQRLNKKTVLLRVVQRYGEWGYDDTLQFYLPAIIQESIEASSYGLLAWIDQNLTDVYVNDKE